MILPRTTKSERTMVSSSSGQLGDSCRTIELINSLKYHRLHPEYIHQRIEKMRNMYRVRILLVLCDVVSLPSGCFEHGHGS